MKNEIIKCFSCDYKWIKGERGSHDCSTYLFKSNLELTARVAQLENGYSQILSEISTTSHAENYKLLDIISRALETK